MYRKAAQVKESIEKDAELFERDQLAPLSKGQKGAIVGTLQKAWGGDRNRKVCLSWLFNPVPLKPKSTRDLTEGQWYGLSRWIDSYHDQDEMVWRTQPDFETEALSVLNQALTTFVRTHPGLSLEMYYEKLDCPLTAWVVEQGGVIKGME